MPKLPTRHRYSDEQAFERLILLIATILEYPGVGSEELDSQGSGEALIGVRKRLREMATRCGVPFPDNYPSTSTLREDLKTLRRYGLLQNRMYRWGYYLGYAALDQQQLRLALQAIASQADNLKDTLAQKTYQILEKRLRGLDNDLGGTLFYPVRQQLNRAMMLTNPEEMQVQGQWEETLYHQLDRVEQAILDGEAIELSRRYDAYHRGRGGMEQLWPLQLVFYHRAWYLVYEDYHQRHLVISRIDRLGNYCRVLPNSKRSLSQQLQRLKEAHKLLTNGWGLYLGNPTEQKNELCGHLKPPLIQVRFFAPVVKIILEGSQRHPKQQVKLGDLDENGKHEFVDYQVKLPSRSHPEFMQWIHSYMDHVQVIAPQSLAQQHLEAAQRLVERYKIVSRARN